MRRRRNADEVARMLPEADRDLAKGLTGGDVCRKLGIAQNITIAGSGATSPRSLTPSTGAVNLEVEAERELLSEGTRPITKKVSLMRTHNDWRQEWQKSTRQLI